jgi:hypothetical protein
VFEGEKESGDEGDECFHNFKKAWPILSYPRLDASEKLRGVG